MIQEIEIRSQDDFDRAVLDLRDDWLDVDFLPFLDDLHQGLETLHDNYFQAETGPGPNKWAQLAPTTIARKGHAEILVDTNRLKSSLVGRTADSVRESFQEEGHAWLRFGTDVEYSQYHNNPAGRLPFRPHVGLEQADIDAIAMMAMDHQVDELQKLLI